MSIEIMMDTAPGVWDMRNKGISTKLVNEGLRLVKRWLIRLYFTLVIPADIVDSVDGNIATVL